MLLRIQESTGISLAEAYIATIEATDYTGHVQD